MVIHDWIHRASRALAHGDPLGAITATGVRDDAHALALRGIALAQLREYPKARALLTRAVGAFARDGDTLHRARALGALAEIAAAERDVARAVAMLSEAADELRAHGDQTNAAWAELVCARLGLLDGDLTLALERIARARGDAREGGTDVVRAAVHLANAEVAMRAARAGLARRLLVEARTWAQRSCNLTLLDEILRLEVALAAPIAFEVRQGNREPIDLFRLESILAPQVMGGPRWLVVDALRRRVTVDSLPVADLRTRPVLLALLASLARAWPSVCSAAELVGDVFASRTVNESHRARLRVEVGRLRRVLGNSVTIVADRGGFRLKQKDNVEIVLVEPLETGEAAAVRALLADGEAWPVRSIALALGRSARTVQRSLLALCETGAVRAIGNAKARRYARVDAGERIASQMLLLGIVTGG